MSYVNREQSGVVAKSNMGKKDPVAERVMMIAERLVALEQRVTQLEKKSK